MAISRAQARVGTFLLDKWRLDELLGVGGMAAVYAATHRNGMRGAVKILLPAHSGAGDIRQRFLREGYLANRISHPGVVRVLDDDSMEDGTPFLVMELIDGATLATRAAESGGKLPVQQVLLASDQLLDVLAAAHDEGIVHRDIKPENVMVTRQGAIKVLDFGIARLLAGDGPPTSATQTGFAMGTPGFMAPEQARGRPSLVDARSDLFSVGSTMFALLSGEMIHREETVPELMAALFLKPARLLADAIPDAPLPLSRVVDTALKLDKAERWSSAREMQRALRAAYREMFGTDPGELPRTRVSLISDLERRSSARPRPEHLRARVTPTAAGMHDAGATVQAMATESIPVLPAAARKPWRIVGAVAAVALGFGWFVFHPGVPPSATPSASSAPPAMAAAPAPSASQAVDSLIPTVSSVASAPRVGPAALESPNRPAAAPATSAPRQSKKQAKPSPSGNIFERRY